MIYKTKFQQQGKASAKNRKGCMKRNYRKNVFKMGVYGVVKFGNTCLSVI
jgi:hypothetical protein